jgi:Ni,Fe-hydrogenase I cytochrome b subunit
MNLQIKGSSFSAGLQYLHTDNKLQTMKQQGTSANENTSFFLESHSASLRVWHWLTFLVLTSIIVTVLMASTVLNPGDNVPIVQNVLKQKGITADNNQTFAVTHLYDDKMWDLHKLLGYGLVILFISRVVIEFTLPKKEKNPARISKALMAYLQASDPLLKKELRHYLVVKWSYMLFYGILFLMAVTGLIISFGGDLGISSQSRHTVKEIHGFIQWIVYAFILFHLAGIILAEVGKAKGIVSGMIHGKK